MAASPVPPSAPDRLRAAYRRARTRLAPFMRQATFVTLCLIALFSLMMIMGIVFRSVRTRRLNAELSQRRAQLNQTAEPAVLFTAQPAPSAALSATPAPSSTPVPSRAPAPSPSGRPLASAIPIVKSTAYHRVGGTALPHMEALYADNHDLVGWIEIPEVLDLPVLYRDNSYYLTRDFYKKKNASGSIFLDVNHRFGEHTQNLLLHGHNMKDGTMFGRLVHYYQDLDYFKRNAFVHYDTLWEQQQYVMFAVLRVSLDVQSDHFFDYFSHPSFATDESFEYYVRALQLGSMYAVPIDVEPRDALLTLSTCMGDDRLVIVCRRLREDESRSSLRQQIRLTTWQ